MKKLKVLKAREIKAARKRSVCSDCYGHVKIAGEVLVELCQKHSATNMLLIVAREIIRDSDNGCTGEDLHDDLRAAINLAEGKL